MCPTAAQMAIDTRYFPQPKHLRVPLYPLAGFPFVQRPLRSDPQTELALRVARCCGVAPESVFLGTSARHVLSHFLRWLRLSHDRDLNVALPDFYCEHTALEMANAGARLAFADVDLKFCLDTASLQSRCEAVVFPDLFVGRGTSDEYVGHAGDALAIYDRAHTFPLLEQRHGNGCPVELASFGASKLLSGVGGGALILRREAIARDFRRYWERLELVDTASLVATMSGEVMSSMRVWLRRRASSLGMSRPLLRDKRESLERELAGLCCTSVCGRKPISRFAAAVVLARWDRFSRIWPRYLQYVRGILDDAGAAFGREAIVHYEDTDRIGMVALRVPPEHRYAIAGALAERGMQATWYYYPLHLLSTFARFGCIACPVAERLTSEVLVLPVHWTQAERNVTPDWRSAFSRAADILA